MKYFILLSVTLFYCNASAQKLQTKLLSSFELEADFFIGIDDFESIYYVKDNTFYKKSQNYVSNYTNLSLGNITTVDIHNPFKIILFFKNFNSIVILDNKLNELTDKIDFTKETLISNVLLMSYTSENNLWLFADDNKFHLYDFQNHSEKIQPQPMAFYHENFIPTALNSTYKNTWILGESGVIQINEYGNYIDYFELKNLDKIIPFQKGFIYKKDNSLWYHYDNQSSEIIIPKKYLHGEIHANNSSISIFYGSKVYQYEIL